MYSEVIKQLDNRGINYQQQVSMKTRTWIHRGPIIPLYIIPESSDELEFIIRLLIKERVDYKVVGHTSNIYMLDSYKIGAIISTNKLGSMQVDGNILKLETGVNISRLSKKYVGLGYQGFEGLIGLPGTVGAAIANNASCFGCAPSKMLVSATVLIIKGNNVQKKLVDKDFFQFSHRSSIIKRNEIQVVILDVSLNLHKTENVENLIEIAEHNINWRKLTQEGKANNLGSIYSDRVRKPIKVFACGFFKSPFVFFFLFISKFFRNKKWYKDNHTRMLLALFGYRDLVPYVSPKNLNCFIWKDNQADQAFVRYQEFMAKVFELGTIEIEILK